MTASHFPLAAPPISKAVSTARRCAAPFVSAILGALAASPASADEPVFVYVGSQDAGRPGSPALVDTLPSAGRRDVRVELPDGIRAQLGELWLVALTRSGAVLRVGPGELDAYVSGKPGERFVQLGLSSSAVQLLAPAVLPTGLGGRGTDAPVQGPLLQRKGIKSYHASVPDSGEEGTTVRVHDDFSSYAGSYEPEDIMFFGAGDGGWFGTVEALNTGSVDATIDFMPELAREKNVVLRFGDGESVSLPDFNEVSFGDAGRWRCGPGAPEHVSLATFSPRDGRLFTECLEPNPYVNTKGVLHDGALHFQLPGEGPCLGDQVSFRISLLRSDGECVAVYLKDTSPLPALTWATAGNFIDYVLSGLLAPYNLTASTDPVSAVLTIEATDSETIVDYHPESFVRLRFDMNEHAAVDQMHGIADSYAGGVESPNADPAFVTFVSDITLAGAGRDYDLDVCAEALAETLTGFGTDDLDGAVRSAKLGLRVRGFSCSTDDDTLALGWNGAAADAGGAMEWRVALNVLDTDFDPNDQWSPGEDVFLCLDLTELPIPGGKTVNILEGLRDGQLDFFVENDTTIDFAWIRVLRCDD